MKQISFIIFVVKSVIIRIFAVIVRMYDFRFLKKIVFAATLLLLCTSSFCAVRGSFEERNHYIKSIGTDEGLTQPGITAVHTDSDGNVWIGTRYRLNRYVNGNLSLYDDTRLEGSRINMLFEDSKGMMWVGTDSGLSRYDRETDSFSIIYRGGIYCALEYSGKIYFAGHGDIVILDVETGEITFLPVGTTRIIKVMQLKEGVLLFADKNTGFYYYDTSTGGFGKFNAPSLGNALIQSAEIIDGNLFVGIYLKGLYKIDADGKLLERYGVDEYPDLSLGVICDIRVVDSRICLATDGSGICTIENGKVIPITSLPEYADLAVLPSATTCIYQDPYSNIWIGSVKDGLFGIKHTPIRHITDFDDIHGLFGKTAILCICADDNCLWIGTDKGVLNYRFADHSIIKVSSTEGDIISSIGLAGKEKILISVYCKGLFTIDKNSGRKEAFIAVNENVASKEINSGFDTKICNLSDTDILIAGKNVYRYDCLTDNFSTLTYEYGTNPSELHPFFNSNRETVFAYNHNGVFKLDISKNHISRIIEPKGCGRINTSYCKCGKLFIGTDTGLLQYDEKSGAVDNVYPGALDRITYVGDRGGDDIWIVADDILYSYDYITGHIEMFDEAEGFISKEVSYCVNTSDCFCFAGNHNLSLVPYNITRNAVPNPSLALYKATVDGLSYKLENGSRLKLHRNFKNAQLDFKILKGDPFRHTLVRYTINGKTSITEETYENYFRLPPLVPGKYSVSASIFRLDGSWGESVKFLDFEIPDILTHRKWFIVCLTFLILAILALVIKLVMANADRKLAFAILRNKEDEQSRRSRFIHSVEAEMRKPLTQIRKAASAILDSDSELSEKTQERLNRICFKSLQIEEMIRDAVGQEQVGEDLDPVIAKFNSVIEENVANANLDVSLLVREMAMSRSVLYDKIKELTNMGVNEYVQKFRMARARKLLVETDKDLLEIAESVGFTSLKYFSEVFKNTYGVSPREFRKNTRI